MRRERRADMAQGGYRKTPAEYTGKRGRNKPKIPILQNASGRVHFRSKFRIFSFSETPLGAAYAKPPPLPRETMSFVHLHVHSHYSFLSGL